MYYLNRNHACNTGMSTKKSMIYMSVFLQNTILKIFCLSDFTYKKSPE